MPIFFSTTARRTLKQKFFALFFIFSLLLQGAPVLVYANGNGNDGHKIAICHIPQGNPENMQTIEVDEHSVTLEAHLKHGDSIGACVTPPPPPPPVNQPPVITLVGGNPIELTVGGTYVDQGATAADPEDGNITGSIVLTGAVDSDTVGSYVLTYTVTDSQGLAATPVTRTVNVVSGGGGGGGGTPAQCADGSDNDGDALSDFPNDPGCDNSDDNDESNAGTPTGGGGGTPKQCSDGSDNDNDALADFPNDPGCANSDDDDETNTTTPTGGGGGGGGGGSGSPAQPPVPTTQASTGGGITLPALIITNERLTSVDADTVTVTWTTNIPATSQVVYGDDPVATLATPPSYGYDNETPIESALSTAHAVTISGVSPNAPTYFRPVSSANGKTALGIELTRGGVLGEEEGCFYLRDYLRLGMKNDPAEVTKLQTFLRDYEEFSDLSVTGFFGPETDKAVRAFQDRYRDDVLVPWNLPENTGYVYYTTRKKVNEIYCARAFPLDQAQISEIDAFRSFISALNVAKPKVAYAAGAEVTPAVASESASTISVKDTTETTPVGATTDTASLEFTTETRGATLKDMLQARAGSAVVTSDANYFDEATDATLPHETDEVTGSDTTGEEKDAERRSLKSIISVGLIFALAVLIAG